MCPAVVGRERALDTGAERRARRPTPPMEAEVEKPEKVGMQCWDADLSGGLHGVRPRTDFLYR
jgi:hypothetical protein